jgi:hypothetical protein
VLVVAATVEGIDSIEEFLWLSRFTVHGDTTDALLAWKYLALATGFVFKGSLLDNRAPHLLD